MLSRLGFAGLLAILGTFAAVVWTVVLGVGGAPGSALVIPFVIAVPLAAVGFWHFVRWPALLEVGWGWLPTFRR